MCAVEEQHTRKKSIQIRRKIKKEEYDESGKKRDRKRREKERERKITRVVCWMYVQCRWYKWKQ